MGVSTKITPAKKRYYEARRKAFEREPESKPGVEKKLLGTKVPPKKQKLPRERFNIGGRANLLEEMGRIDARKHPDAADRAEKSRVIGELNRGYKKGGQISRQKSANYQSDRRPSQQKVRKAKAGGGLIKGKPKLAKKGWK